MSHYSEILYFIHGFLLSWVCKLVVQIPYGDSVRKLRMGKIGSFKEQKELVLLKHILTLLCVFGCFNSEKNMFWWYLTEQ
jgi:hypothetical protein